MGAGQATGPVRQAANAGTTVRPMGDIDPFTPAVELAAAVKRREVSPVELADLYLGRVDEYPLPLDVGRRDTLARFIQPELGDAPKDTALRSPQQLRAAAAAEPAIFAL